MFLLKKDYLSNLFSSINCFLYIGVFYFISIAVPEKETFLDRGLDLKVRDYWDREALEVVSFYSYEIIIFSLIVIFLKFYRDRKVSVSGIISVLVSLLILFFVTKI